MISRLYPKVSTEKATFAESSVIHPNVPHGFSMVFPFSPCFHPMFAMSSFWRPRDASEVEFGGEGAAAHGHLPSGDLLAEPLAPLATKGGDIEKPWVKM
jgi:hypothetical protein